MGASIEEIDDGRILCRAPILKGADIYLEFPSVGATENIILSAINAYGVTTVFNAAREPEIVDLQDFLNACGARVVGAGTSTVVISGSQRCQCWSDIEYEVMPDRIAAGTYMVCTAAAGGVTDICGCRPEHLSALGEVLKEAGCEVKVDGDTVRTSAPERLKRVRRIVSAPYPGFPTDMQAQVMAMLSLADGTSVIKETVFENRYRHVDELNRMGANIWVSNGSAVIEGVGKLRGASVHAPDLRGGAALAVAALAAEGTTLIARAELIDRGYDDMCRDLKMLGADIWRG